MEPDELFDRVATSLAPEGAAVGAMFGSRALMFGGRSFACLNAGWFACKLGAGTADHGAALALPGAELFDPASKGRPFKDWVAIPSAQADQWPAYAEAALAAGKAGAVG